MTVVAEADYLYIAREVRARTGLVLSPDKAHLIDARAGPIARREGFLSVQELITTARARRDERLLNTIADALITSETQFFRDRAPFAFFRSVMAGDLAARRGPGGRLRIWCAGCSSGQEPYSLAMALEEMKTDGRTIECEIIATDISTRLLEKARAGLFSQFEVQRGLPILYLLRHFEKVGDLWRISDRMRAQVKFQAFNLLDDPRALGQFDIIFCRNVLIYFDSATQRVTLDRLAGLLADDGYLVLGASEQIAAADLFAAAAPRVGVFTRAADARRAA